MFYLFRHHRKKLFTITYKTLVVLSCIMAGLVLSKSFFQNTYQDFTAYYSSSLLLKNGGNPYSIQENNQYLFLYPPPTFFILFPLSFLPLLLAQKIFWGMSLMCLVLAVYFFFRKVQIQWSSLEGLSLILLILNYFPLKFTLGMGQINLLVLMFLSVFFFFYPKKIIKGGISLALSLMMKVFPILALCYFLIARNWRLLIVCFIACFTLMLISIPIVSLTNIHYFFTQALPQLAGSWSTAYYNQSLVGFLGRTFGENRYSYLGYITLVIITLVFQCYVTDRAVRHKNKMRQLILSSWITLTLLLSPVTWQHHLVWLLLPLGFTYTYLKQIYASKVLFSGLLASFLLTAINLEVPAVVSPILQSHGLWGVSLLWMIQLSLLIQALQKPSFLHKTAS